MIFNRRHAICIRLRLAGLYHIGRGCWAAFVTQGSSPDTRVAHAWYKSFLAQEYLTNNALLLVWANGVGRREDAIEVTPEPPRASIKTSSSGPARKRRRS